ncbi:(2Fe-2S)-binding protein [Corynebacterium sp. H113]|uniref:(2Fe-2S)-binding protein n=1 Tax=Corynebacterium sp. H113 TaxID=3133419 RepID=UPI0030AFC7F0
MEIGKQYLRLLGEMPRLRAEVVPDVHVSADAYHHGYAARDWLSSEKTVSARIDAGHALFPMPDVEGSTRFQAQLWWWSMCGSIVNPSVASILACESAPRLDWGTWTVFERDAYWLGFAGSEFMEMAPDSGDKVIEYGASIARFLAPVAEIVGDVGGLKDAPLWAVAADAVAGAAVAAGNELMMPWAGAAVGDLLVEGMATEYRVPSPRFVDVSEDEVVLTDMEAAKSGEDAPFNVVTHLMRATCCMIYHSPDADLCSSCPKRKREERELEWQQDLLL